MKQKTTLTIEVEYDDEKTDPESLCTALDHMVAIGHTSMVEALIADGYGEVGVYPSLVEAPLDLVIEIEGGALQDVRHAKEQDKRPLHYTLVDHDVEEEDDDLKNFGGQ